MSRRDFLQDFVGTSLWNAVPAKRKFRYAKAVNAGMVETHRLALTMAGVVDRSLDDAEGLQSSDYSTYQIFEAGDLAFKLIDLQNIKTSRVGLVPRRGIMSSAYIRLMPRSDQVCPEFYYWYFFAAYKGNIFNGLGGGIRQNLSPAELLEFPVPDIRRHEQEAIAGFLDRETARLDSLVEKKARFIRLLQEKRRAVVTKVVTTGFQSEVPTSEPGSKWLGRVPTHWIVAPVKHFFSSLDGRRVPLSAEERGKMQGDYPYYGASGIIDHVDRPLFREDLVLVSEDGANLTYRTYPIAFVARGEYWVNNHAHILRPHDGLVDFWAARLEAIDLIPYITGSTQPKLTIENLMNIRVAAPPTVDERREIALRVQAMTVRLDDLIIKTERSIELLKEHRSALITAAVTGKIDVRGFAAKNMKVAA